MRSPCIAIISLVLILFLETPSLAKNFALLIGNSDYSPMGSLNNPENDVRSVGKSLAYHGFEVITSFDRKHEEMIGDISRFKKISRGADISIVYFAGHGFEVNGHNYLVPVDANFADMRDLSENTVSAEALLDAASGAKRLRMLVLDACRTNPFLEELRSTGASRGVARSAGIQGGLAPMQARFPDTLIAYSAPAGAFALDGPIGGNSPFAASLLEALSGPQRDVRLLLGAVRDGVRAKLGPGADPYVYSSLGSADIVINSSSEELFVPKPAREVEAFRDCADCPEMVIIPSGAFAMGSDQSSSGSRSLESPTRTVSVDRFALARTEVTFEQWNACVSDGACIRNPNPNDYGWGRG